MLIELDYDLEACLRENPQPGIDPHRITKVLAVWEGENDGDDWRWVLALYDGTFAFVQGGCDYTGWDCQSWATSAIRETELSAAMCALGDIDAGTCVSPPMGLGHMVSILTGQYMSNAQEVYESLIRQLDEGKAQTWREAKDAELGVVSGSGEPQ